MENYDSLMKGGAHGAPIVPGKADESRIIEMLEGKIAPRMPFGADPLPAADIATIKAWINAGAAGPAAGESTKALAPVGLPEIQPVVPVVSPVSSVKFSPDGKLLAVGGYREVRLIDPSTGKAGRPRFPVMLITCAPSPSVLTERCWRRPADLLSAGARSRYGICNRTSS